MNRRLVFLTAFSAALLVSALAHAQEQRRGQGRDRTPLGGMLRGGASVLGLLRIEAIQKELGVTEEQLAQIRETAGQGRPDLGNLREMSEEERNKAMETLRKSMAELEKKAIKHLTDEQAKRLEEIRVQVLGINTLSDEVVAKKLKITDEQKEQIAEATTEFREKLREAMSGGGGFDREAFAKMREDLEAAMTKVLTEKQTAKLEKLKGKEFDLSQLPRTRGGRRGRGN